MSPSTENPGHAPKGSIPLRDVPHWIRTQAGRGGASLKLIWRIDRLSALSVLALTLVAAGLPLAIAYVGKMIIDAVVAHSVALTARYVAVELALVALQTLAVRSVTVARTLLGMKAAVEINCLILEKATDLQLAQVENPAVQDKLNRAAREADSRPLQMVIDTCQILQNVLTLFGYVGLLYAYTPLAAVVLLLAALPATVAEMRFSNRGFILHNWRSPDRRRISYLENVLVSEAYAKEVRALRLAPLFLGRYRALSEKLYLEDKDLAVRRSIWATALTGLALLAFYGFYLVVAERAADGVLQLGNLTLYVVALRQGQQAFQTALSSLGSMYEHNLYMSNLFDFLALSSPVSLPRPRAGATRAPLPADAPPGLVFEGVSFRYPGQTKWVLQDINLAIRQGESLSLIGFNGAGKTTLIKLLCRLYEPTTGRILLDGRDLRDWSAAELFRRLSVVFQDFSRYQLSFGENIAVGDVEHFEDDTRTHSAAQRGGASALFLGLPEGLKTQLGRSFGGLELSGGQWQRVALSRVFMKADADILILDEPTAALDAAAEHASLQAFRELARGKTSIIISHHFPVARVAERIIVLEEGRIIEDGSHEALIARQGRYAYLFSLQADGYA
jgi:ATP-binding cassette subfamily B protein